MVDTVLYCMILIATAGAARAGKDTLAKTIKAFIPNTVTLAFADAVKDEAEPICQARFGLSAWTQDPEEKKIVRPVLIEVGHGRRQEDPLIWINKLREKLGVELSKHNVIVTDCRYKNEADMIHSEGGMVVFVQRDSQLLQPTEAESLPLIEWDIKIDFGKADTISLIKQVIPGFQA